MTARASKELQLSRRFCVLPRFLSNCAVGTTSDHYVRKLREPSTKSMTAWLEFRYLPWMPLCSLCPYRHPLYCCLLLAKCDGFRCREQALQQCNHERFGLPGWSYIRALENAIVRAVEAGAREKNDAASASASGGGDESL